MTEELGEGLDISMEEIFREPRVVTPEKDRQHAEYIRLSNEKVLFRGVERKRGDFCCFANEPLGDNPELSYSGFTAEETERAAELAQPFNDKYNNDDDEISMSMFAKWMDKDGFIFAVIDDFGGTTVDAVHERDLEKFLADRKVTKN
jgi:hypothetical protein